MASFGADDDVKDTTMEEAKGGDATMASDSKGFPDKSMVVDLRHMNFGFMGTEVLHDITLSIKPGSRVLLVGANGAGKTTLLRVIAGKHFAPFDTLSVLGTHAPQDQCNGLSFLGERWTYTVAFAGTGVAYSSDIPVHKMSERIQEKYRERRDRLVELLDIDMNWRMHQVSDGQRRRVQIMLGLLRPFQLLLMDEVTVDLDVVARQDLLNFLKEECEERNATVIFATHIYDGIDDWPSHLMRISDGKATPVVEYDQIPELQENIAKGHKAPLHKTVLDWLREERRLGKNMSKPSAEDRARATKLLGPQGGWASGRAGGTPTENKLAARKAEQEERERAAAAAAAAAAMDTAAP